jgi:biopolymer transport protein ExbD
VSRHKKKKQEGVTLNLAAMLDMAFQLLTFFILTFRPAPVEGQVALRLPPAQAVANATGKNDAGKEDKPAVDIKGVDTLTITLFSQSGNLDQMGVGATEVKNLTDMAVELAKAFKDPNSPFEQVIIQSSPKLRYGELMRVVELCTHQTKADGQHLGKLSFIEIPEGEGK